MADSVEAGDVPKNGDVPRGSVQRTAKLAGLPLGYFGRTALGFGKRIGGMSAEIVAMVTIGAADGFGLPVSTTHVLSSGVAGTMAANKSGLQWSTIRNLAMAWVLTLPAAVLLSGSLYWLFTKIF